MTVRPSTRLIRLLKTPAQVANALDWKRSTSSTVATLHIGRDRIGMAIATHPDLGGKVQTVQPLELELITKDTNQRALAPDCVREIRELCDHHQVGSFLVWWPLQREGRPGARCGKVLHTLESLIEQANDTILTPKRPIALWTGDRHKDEHEKYAEDEWGRSSVYSRCVYDKTVHRASTEQYCHPSGSSATAAETWEEFCKQYWPDCVVQIESALHEEERLIAAIQPKCTISQDSSVERIESKPASSSNTSSQSTTRMVA